jgi:hypothetical protein
MLVGVTVAALAGFGRDRELRKTQATSGSFYAGLLMTVVAGILSSFMSLAFVYSQYPIVANLSLLAPGKAIKVTVDGQPQVSGEYTLAGDGTLTLPGMDAVAVGGVSAWEASERISQRLASERSIAKPRVVVETGSIPATFGVFAVGLVGGALVNLGYAVYLLTKKKSWHVLTQSWRELLLAVIIGVNFSVAVALMGKGMLLLGSLGASVGFGIQQAMQMTGAQLLGFVSGEWRGVQGTPRRQMYVAIGILVAAAVIMAFGNTLGKG